VKGFGLPIAGHKDNHAGLMTPAQMETFRSDEHSHRARVGPVRRPARQPEQVKASWTRCRSRRAARAA
jgi:hypothetical protein